MLQTIARCCVLSLLLAVVGTGIVQPAAAADEALDQAFEALKKYDWGSDRTPLAAIDEAVVATHNDATARLALEKRLAAVLSTNVPYAAKDFVCRKLSLIGTAASVPALAPLLLDEKLSHMARYALERIPDDAAAEALRQALPKTSGLAKVGVINSLGARRDTESTPVLVKLAGDKDPQIAAAAATALGKIGTTEAADALKKLLDSAEGKLRLVAADAYLACAEQLLQAGKKADALAIYQSLSKADVPKHVRLAAVRGMLTAAGKK